MILPKKVIGHPRSFGWLKLSVDPERYPYLDLWEAPDGKVYVCDRGTTPKVAVWRIGAFTSPPILGEEH